MRRSSVMIVMALAVGLVWARPVQAAKPREEPLVDQVRQAIKKGMQFLRDQQTSDGNWEVDPASAGRRGGWTSLAMLALLNCGVKPEDPMIQKGLKYLRQVPRKDTYVVGLQTMVYAAVGDPQDKLRIQHNVDWLIEARVLDGAGRLQGWTYSKLGHGSDNSNTQYALLGLHEGHLAGAKVPPAIWESIQDYYIRTQNRGAGIDGSWGYNPNSQEARLTMTTAGLCGLLISGKELNQGREKIRADGTAANCGEYDDTDAIQRALKWIGDHFNIEIEQAPRAIYYNLYGIERAGQLSGLRFFGRHDWYREGCKWLVKPGRQQEDGSWRGSGQLDSWPVISTSFSLLFLSKGRTPVLISKLPHEPQSDWNNDRNDARHLVEFVSRELFKRQRLAWQVFDPDRATVNSQDDLLDLTGELLQSPIVYFNGHEAPRFSDTAEGLLKEYVKQGGFVLAEACCGKKNFDQGFRQLVKKLWPDADLTLLPPEHPIWHAHYALDPRGFKLYGLQQGCKTVLVYSPQDLSCFWESNQFAEGKSKDAFQLGANIIAYATGMELPKPRLTKVEVIDDDPGIKKVPPRGYLQVVQLQHEGDWQPAPRAMRNLMAYMRDKPRLDVAVQTEALAPSDRKMLNFKFLYLHGRNRFSFDNDPKALANLRANLQTGGLLLADACCGKKEFDESFRHFVKTLFPKKNLERIPLSDDLFSQELNGAAIKTVRCRREKADGSGPEEAFHDVPPFLEGIQYNGRWVVIYSKYDLGCALQHHQSSDCLGHDYASALKLAGAAVLYAMKR